VTSESTVVGYYIITSTSTTKTNKTTSKKQKQTNKETNKQKTKTNKQRTPCCVRGIV
jgi:hypothetical protein